MKTLGANAPIKSAPIGPEIRIALGDPAEPVRIVQHRPSIAQVLRGCDPATALARVPLLLPVCGVAQGVAAARALDAATGRPADRDTEIRRDLRVLAERAGALAWRLALDWPALLDRPAEPARVKAIRQAATLLSSAAEETAHLDISAAAQRGRALAETLTPLFPEGVSDESGGASVEEILERPGTSTAHAVLSRAVSLRPKLRTAPMLCPDPAALTALARAAFEAEPFDPLAPKSPGPVACGPASRLPAAMSAPDLARRLAAMALDVHAFADQLNEALDGSRRPVTAIETAPGAGLGTAMTARGPICHHVRLDGSGRSIDWRILAPTDWHFAPDGPVVRELGLLDHPDPFLARLVVASFDPCCPIGVTMEGAHA